MRIISRPTARHILTFAQTLCGGGVERAQLRLAADWLEAGRRVTLAIGSTDGPLAAELPAGIEIVALGSPDYRALFGVAAVAARLAPDAVFCPGNHYTSAAAWLRLRLGRGAPPIVAKLSNALDRPDQRWPVSQGYRAWLRLHPRFIDRLVAMSPAMRDEAARLMRFPDARLSTIPNPPVRHPPDTAPPPMPAGRFVLGVGRLEPQKRWDRLIDAMGRIADASVSLLILGEGSERARLQARIAQAGLADRVMLPGHALDPAPAIRAAAVVALTSDYEGAPGILREALSLGTPVVATNASVAVREIVPSPTLGEVVPIGDDDALVAALDHWLAPGAVRPAPVPEPGADSAARYLALFDALVTA